MPAVSLPTGVAWWRSGIGCRTCDQEVAASTSGRALLLRNDSGQVVHTHGRTFSIYVCPLAVLPILYRFRDIAGYMSKVADFDHPTCIWRPRRG